MYDVIIAGGGPAGLTAALVLARSRRNIIIVDAGKPRNRTALGVHNFLTRDGIQPGEFLELARSEISKYHVEIINAEVIEGSCHDNIFRAVLTGNKIIYSKKFLIATGVQDILPEIQGASRFFGKGLFHCPYCDAFEVRDQPLGVTGKKKHGLEAALGLRTWSDDITFYTNNDFKITPAEIRTYADQGIKIEVRKIARLKGNPDLLSHIVMADGSEVSCKGLFFKAGFKHSHLVEQFKCSVSPKGVVKTDRMQKTNIHGLFVAGDASRDVQLVVVAASEGAKAAVGINMELQEEERSRTE